MAGLEDGLFSFFANAPAGAPTSYPAMEARRKIALAVMANSGRKGFPKTLGEGLTAIGDAIGERGVMNQLAAQEAAYQKQATAAYAGAVPAEARAAPAPAPAAVAPTSYAPPGDTAETPAEAPATAAPATGGGWNEGNWGKENFMDAQANMGLKPNMPGYLQDAITSREPDPGMQAYFGALSAKEAPKGAGDVSPTGAAGPYQFTRGTGAQYGIPGSQRMDPAASTDAVRALTADNAAAFQRINGRPPSYADLALMHQQGGVTGARMAGGTGNAPPDNLAVNNIPPGASAANAAAQIGRFYGMPNTPAPVSSRAAIAAQLAARQNAGPAQAVPQPNPTLAGPTPFNSEPAPGGDQALPFAGLPPEISQGASRPQPAAQPPLPAMAQGIQPAPPGAGPPPTPQRLVPQQRVTPPTESPMTDDEKRGYQLRAQGAAMGDENMQRQGQSLIEYGAGQRKQEYDARLKDWQDRMAEQHQRQLAEEAFTRAQGTPQAQAEAQLKAKELDIAKRFGGQAGYQQFNTDMAKGHDAIQPLANTLPMYDQAKTALKDAYTGAGADLKLDANKMLRSMGAPGNYTPLQATEILRSRMSAIAAGFVKGTVGSQNISNQDVAFVQKAYSGDINMEPESLRRLLNIAQEAAIKTVNQHNDRLLSVANNAAEDQGLRNMYRVPMQYGKDAEILKQQGQDPKIRDYFDQKYGRGHAAAVLRGVPYGD